VSCDLAVIQDFLEHGDYSGATSTAVRLVEVENAEIWVDIILTYSVYDPRHNLVGISEIVSKLALNSDQKGQRSSTASHLLSLLKSKSHKKLQNLYRSSDEQSICEYGHNIAGISYFETNSFKSAVKALKTSIARNSRNSRVHLLLAKSLIKLKDFQGAKISSLNAIACAPDDFECYFILGEIERQLNNKILALKAYNVSTIINPKHTLSHLHSGNVHLENSEHHEAAIQFNKVLEVDKDNFLALNNMALCHRELGNTKEALNLLLRIPRHDANKEVLNNIGLCFFGQGNVKAASNYFSAALNLDPLHSNALNNLGLCKQEMGELSEAKNLFSRAVSSNEFNYEATRHLSKLVDLSEATILLERLDYTDPNSLNTQQKANIFYTKFNLCDKLGSFEQGISHLILGNKYRACSLRYNYSADVKLFENLHNTLNHLERIQIVKSQKSCPIFIVGMPRSGTTLVEQILAPHSSITALGELDIVDRFAYNSVYNEEVVPSFSASLNNFYFSHKVVSEVQTRFFTDKMPHNFLYLPLLQSAFMEPKIIHVFRDAREVCWSNYSTYFGSKGLGYSYDLDNLMSYWKMYLDLMKKWQTELDIPIYNLNYNKLINSPNLEISKLLSFLGLNIEKACFSPEKHKRQVKTASQLQVLKKIDSSVSRKWINYKKFLPKEFHHLKNWE
jgi:tetratricopeptide (TPR) repeat protein